MDNKITNIKRRLHKPIVLIGLMGVGKTQLGRIVAKELGVKFVDSDDEIVKAAGMPISDIFEKFGEEYFRAGERRVIKRLMEDDSAVIATGGGAVTSPETADLLWSEALSVWLNADIDVLCQRTAGHTKRPLLNNNDPRAVLQKLSDERTPLYQKANIHIDTGNGSLSKMKDEILSRVESYLQEQE